MAAAVAGNPSPLNAATGASAQGAGWLKDDVLRLPHATIRAIPVLLGSVVVSLLRRGGLRAGAGLGAAAAGALLLVALTATPGSAVPASPPRLVSADLFAAIGIAHGAAEPLMITFDRPMDAPSVAAALSIHPAADYRLSWDAAGRVLTVRPVAHWEPDTLYRLQVAATARGTDGVTLGSPLQRVVLTGPGGTAALDATMRTLTAVRLDTAFRVTLDRPTTAAAVSAALRSAPAVQGEVVETAIPTQFLFRPLVPLAPAAVYRLWLDGLVDADGVPFEPARAITVATVDAPELAAIVPAPGSRTAAPGTTISVSFSTAMDEAATAKALHVAIGRTAIRGATGWSDDGQTLTFTPARVLPAGSSVRVTIDATARSAAGAPLAGAVVATFRVRSAAGQRTPASRVVPIATGAAGAVAGSWLAVERYYLQLMNCTRTGGWVTSSGSCSSPGGRNVAPLALSSVISSKVSRPYARLLATSGACSHFIGGTPGDRLRRAGFSSYRWAENLGCRSGDPYAAVLGSHLFFQAEKPTNGGHYRNLMNAAYDRVGIGVWVSSGRVRLVVDFYHP